MPLDLEGIDGLYINGNKTKKLLLALILIRKSEE